MPPDANMIPDDSWLDLFALLCASVGTLIFSLKERLARRKSGLPPAQSTRIRR
jgi:hypothetical protein